MRRIGEEIQVVLFDIGGVLVELRGVPTMLAWLDHRVSRDELFRLWLSSPVVRRFETGLASPAAFADEIVGELSLPVTPEEFIVNFQGWAVGLLPDALDLVRSVPSRFTRATLSNNSVLHWQRMMKEFGLEGAFHHHFASHLTGKIKPDRDAYQNVLETLHCEASSVFFLDDSSLNVEAARQIGMHAVKVAGPAQARRALVEAGILNLHTECGATLASN